MLMTDELENALKNYPNFNGVFAVDQLPEVAQPGLYIANTDESNEDGEHWVLYYVCNDGTIEFLDTFGRKPHKRWHGDWKYNTRMIQCPLSTACGYHVLSYAHLRRFYPFEQIMGWYGEDLPQNDKIARYIARRVYNVK